MEFTLEQISSFKDLYKNKFGIDLSDTESAEELNNLVSLVKEVYKPITIEDYIETNLTKIRLYEQSRNKA